MHQVFCKPAIFPRESVRNWIEIKVFDGKVQARELLQPCQQQERKQQQKQQQK